MWGVITKRWNKTRRGQRKNYKVEKEKGRKNRRLQHENRPREREGGGKFIIFPLKVQTLSNISKSPGISLQLRARRSRTLDSKHSLLKFQGFFCIFQMWCSNAVKSKMLKIPRFVIQLKLKLDIQGIFYEEFVIPITKIPSLKQPFK